jgi:hypothetical protein
MYPIQPISSLFLPRFNNFVDVNSLASMGNMPYLPYKIAPIYKPIAYSTRSHSSLPSGVANYDRLAIRDFDNVDSVLTYRQGSRCF